jgi:hypothetical protein
MDRIVSDNQVIVSNLIEKNLLLIYQYIYNYSEPLVKKKQN